MTGAKSGKTYFTFSPHFRYVKAALLFKPIKIERVNVSKTIRKIGFICAYSSFLATCVASFRSELDGAVFPAIRPWLQHESHRVTKPATSLRQTRAREKFRPRPVESLSHAR